IFGIIFMITLLSAYNPSEKVDSLYETSASQAINYGPTVYTQQWQKAMQWVRDNTPENAVFGHWWDYGYWVQSIGNRATVLDGGNALGYWNYLMGRYALTGTSNQEALEVLYSHNTTHFLIDSSDLGKYSAFSSIGSDANYDRYSWIPILLRNPSQSQETKSSVLNVYNGGFYLESDIVYDINGTKIFLLANKAAIAGIIVETDLSGNILSQPQGVFFYQNKEYRLPLRYAYDTKFTDFGAGIESGIYLLPQLDSSGGGLQINKIGTVIYLNSKTVNSQLARLYLYKEDNSNFKLVHTEDDYIVSQLKTNNGFTGDFVYYNEFRGPIKIWEINYPVGMKVNPLYIQTNYPDGVIP
ncbi:MAG: STT3 domain-containing protein, partial [archaeon]|nr:STT3 domain-containing protein [archaeon]